MTGKQWQQSLRETGRRFSEIDGEQRAAAFSYFAFLSLFPLLILFVTLTSLVSDREAMAAKLLEFISQYLPIPQGRESLISESISGILKGRGQAGILATLLLLWSAMKFLKVLIRATNRAWRAETYNWWRLPLKSLTLLGIVASAFFIGIVGPMIADLVRERAVGITAKVNIVFDATLVLVPFLVLFYALAMIYKLAPNCRTRFSDVWFAALFVTFLFRLAQALFLFYVRHFSHFNALYGALGGIIAFLMWIYLTGILFVLGTCFCASRAAVVEKATAREA